MALTWSFKVSLTHAQKLGWKKKSIISTFLVKDYDGSLSHPSLHCLSSTLKQGGREGVCSSEAATADSKFSLSLHRVRRRSIFFFNTSLPFSVHKSMPSQRFCESSSADLDDTPPE